MGTHGYPEKFFPDARKFDSGGNMTQVLLSMLRVSLDEVCLLDAVDAQSKLKTLMEPILDWAKVNGMFVPRSHAYHLVGLKPSNIPVEDMIEVCRRLRSNLHLCPKRILSYFTILNEYKGGHTTLD